MSLKELLFSFQGRIGRKEYWMWNLFYYLMIFGFGIGINALFSSYAYLIFPLFLVCFMIPDLAVTAKRWHDRGKSNWWLLLNVPLIIGRMTVPIADPVAPAMPADVSSLQMISSLAALVCGAWILIECGFIKGQQGENQYGSQSA